MRNRAFQCDIIRRKLDYYYLELYCRYMLVLKRSKLNFGQIQKFKQFNQAFRHLLVILTAALSPYYHFIHSLLMTHFTSNYYYTLKIACVSCIFACSYSLSHPFSFTITDYTCRRVKWGEQGTYKTLATLP